ncbi:MAG: hypothetical protein GY894_10700 [Planctomycetes bacterium]|nr:hypothetical protein [Planctomycetota bacterium]MCP4839808.1 hypothetical protein [Planctomycetota bacterium]
MFDNRYGVAGAVAMFCLAIVPNAMFAVEPPDGAEIQTTHVRLVWEAVHAADQYELQVAIDDGSSNPFANLLGDATTATASHIVKDWLEFGDNCLWRTRAIVDGQPEAWLPPLSFSIRGIPPGFPLEVEVKQGIGMAAPGLTIFNHCDQIVGYDTDGGLQLLIDAPDRLSDVRVVPDGRLLCVGGGQARILSLSGEVVWSSPDDADLRVHHCASMTPWGGVLMVVREYRDIEQDGVVRNWQGDRIVEMDPETNAIVFDWSTFDHYDTGDYDVHQTNHWNDWTHVNDAHYEEHDGRVWISSRHLSRVTSIDYDTGDITANIGMAMPSGDVPVGDDLFSYQHSPMLTEDGTLLLFDNGNRRGGKDVGSDGWSRAVEIALTGDPPAQAEIVWSWETPQYCSSTGDANRLANGNTLVTATQLFGIHEVTAEGDSAWNLSILNQEVCVGLRAGYRAVRSPSLYMNTNPQCAGDIDTSGDVGVDDLLTLIGQWGQSGSADLDQSGDVGIDDLLMMLNAWGPCI